MEYPKKLIEVALPLDDINAAAAREKSIRHGHPSTLHLWWARRPLAAARAVLFAQLVNDPGGKRGYGKYKGQSKVDAQRERERLFKIIRDLVKWENTTNEKVLERAREEIRKSWKETCELTGENPEKMPPFLDPFAGGGSIPLEAQRLGLEAHASDLNPVAVMINKAMIEIPPKFAGRKPVGPIPSKEEDKQIGFSEKDWSGAKGLAEDVRRYGHWMRDEAFKRIGHLYPQVDLPKEYGGGKATVIAWLWARTVRSPNPAVNGVHVPLISNFFLSTKKRKEAWVHPVVEEDHYYFTVKTGKPEKSEEIKRGTKLSRGANFQCLLTGVPIAPDYIKAEGKAGRMGVRMMSVVAEGPKGRLYLAPTEEMEKVAAEAQPGWKPENPLPINPRWFSPPDYGMPLYADLFTPRQLVALTTFSDLVQEAREKVIEDYIKKYPLPNPPPLGEGINETDTSSLQHGNKATPSPQHGNIATPSPQHGDIDNSSPQHGNIDNSSPQRGEVGRGAKNNNSPHWRPSPAPPNLIKIARNLRKNLTDAEQLLWHCIRRKQLDGFRFRRQHPIENYILDFYCPQAKLAIELDGGQHNLEKEKKSDKERTAWLKNNDVRVLRFWNNEVFGKLEGVLQQIWNVLHEPSPPPRPSPAGGGSGKEFHEKNDFAGGGSGKDLDEASNFTGEASNNDTESTTLAGEEKIRSAVKRSSLGKSLVCPGEIGNHTQNKQNFDDFKGLNDGGLGATAYGDAVAVYLAFAVDKIADRNSSICAWASLREHARNTFGRQAIPMTWDFAESNPFSNSSGNFLGGIKSIKEGLHNIAPIFYGQSIQADAHNQGNLNVSIYSTDPPYYDNIGYADLSDFFYVWLRRSLKDIFPEIFSTMLVPKEKELVATPYRHGNKQKAENFFMEGMTMALQNMAIRCHPDFPVTIYYAFKQSETAEIGTSSAGWEAFLFAVIKSGFTITGTWPIRTELDRRMVGQKTNALASSIVIVCRKRNLESPIISRKQFVRELEQSLPEALEDMIGGKEGTSPIAPVDLAQAAIGPGMAVYSKYAGVLEADGSPMSVYTALTLINKAIDEYFTRAESSMGPDTRFCVDWFQQYGFKEGPFGEADVLARAKGTTVDGVEKAGVIQAGKGKVRLLKVSEYPDNWDPTRDLRVPVWEACHHLSRALKNSEMVAAALLARMPEQEEPVRQLAYRLYTLCERKGWAEDARNYNELITSWQAIVEASRKIGHQREQMPLQFDR